MDETNNRLQSYLESRVIELQTQIVKLQDLINHYRAVLADYKRLNRVDINVDEITHGVTRDEHVSL